MIVILKDFLIQLFPLIGDRSSKAVLVVLVHHAGQVKHIGFVRSRHRHSFDILDIGGKEQLGSQISIGGAKPSQRFRFYTINHIGSVAVHHVHISRRIRGGSKQSYRAHIEIGDYF